MAADDSINPIIIGGIFLAVLIPVVLGALKKTDDDVSDLEQRKEGDIAESEAKKRALENAKIEAAKAEAAKIEAAKAEAAEAEAEAAELLRVKESKTAESKAAEKAAQEKARLLEQAKVDALNKEASLRAAYEKELKQKAVESKVQEKEFEVEAEEADFIAAKETKGFSGGKEAIAALIDETTKKGRRVKKAEPVNLSPEEQAKSNVAKLVGMIGEAQKEGKLAKVLYYIVLFASCIIQSSPVCYVL